nr:MAG TPA: hypothetical protein [Caudoviricetes sp.]
MVKTNVVNGEKVFAAVIFDDCNDVRCAIVAQDQDGEFKVSISFYNEVGALAKPVIELSKTYTGMPASEALADMYLEASHTATKHIENTCFGSDVKHQQHEVFDALMNALYDVLYAN